jgi:L-ascorbate metabolism protein UlaG (beta-lactamase superfamily)
VSPPLACLNQDTIWSQPGNLYSQIVDLSDVDNSRSMIAPGNAEDAAGRFRTNQIDLWVKGTTHPAPLSRPKVEAMGGSRTVLVSVAYTGPLAWPQRTVERVDPAWRFVEAIPPAAAEPSGIPSQRMTLAEIERALAASPPAWEHGDARAAIAASLDKLIDVQVRDAMTDEDRAKLQPLVEFYRRRVDQGLDALERTPVTEGARVFKFYSSSLVLKSAQGTVAVDFCQGPVNNGGEPNSRDARRTGFYWTPQQRDRLARLVDVSLITHRHHDHADYSLSQRLKARDKPVVGPAQLMSLWKDLARGIQVPNYGQVEHVGPVEVYAMLGRQCAKSQIDPSGQRVGLPNRDNPAADSESVVYLFRLGGIVFLQAAENHVPAGDWLERGVQLGFCPDVVLSVGQFQGQRSVDALLRQRGPAFRIPVHEYELTHDGGGNRTSIWFTGSGRRALEQHRSMPLFWGESFLLTRTLLTQGQAESRAGRSQ